MVDGYSQVISVSKRVVSVTIPVAESTSAGLPISVLKMALSRVIHGVRYTVYHILFYISQLNVDQPEFRSKKCRNP